MKTEKHWTLNEDVSTQSIDVKNKQENTVCTVWLYNKGKKTFADEYFENAKLIASAPELLEALMKVKETKIFDSSVEIGRLINKAIKKATL